MTINLESIPDDAIEAAQDAFHEFAFGPLAFRAAIRAALNAMSDGYEYAQAVDYGDGIEPTKNFWGDPNCAVDEGHFLARRPVMKWEKIGEVVRYGG